MNAVLPAVPQSGVSLSGYRGRGPSRKTRQRSEGTPGNSPPNTEGGWLIQVRAYIDGACARNPGGAGGWAAVIEVEGQPGAFEITGSEKCTTNNRMELMAAIAVLEEVEIPAAINLHSDSRYVIDGITSWLAKWKLNKWRTADGKPVKNADLWQRLDEAQSLHKVRWHWVRGHAGDVLNERVHDLATLAMMEGAT